MPTSKSHVITGLNKGFSRMTFVTQVQCVFCEVVAKFLIILYTIFRHNSIIGRCYTSVIMITLSSSEKKSRSKLNAGSTQERYR